MATVYDFSADLLDGTPKELADFRDVCLDVVKVQRREVNDQLVGIHTGRLHFRMQSATLAASAVTLGTHFLPAVLTGPAARRSLAVVGLLHFTAWFCHGLIPWKYRSPSPPRKESSNLLATSRVDQKNRLPVTEGLPHARSSHIPAAVRGFGHVSSERVSYH